MFDGVEGEAQVGDLVAEALEEVGGFHHVAADASGEGGVDEEGVIEVEPKGERDRASHGLDLGEGLRPWSCAERA